MNEFERRWKLGTARARTVEPVREESAPFGFAARIVANRTLGPALATIWQRLALRVCAALAVVVVALASLQVLSSGDNDNLRPDLEDTVGDLFWAL